MIDDLIMLRAPDCSLGACARRYEGEADALYISITDYTGSSLMLHVEGFGSFPFQAVAC